MSNINRDYLVVIDVKSGSVNRPTMVFYNTDKNTSNIYAQLVVKETIVNATPIENATDFAIELKVVKPGNIVKFMDGILVNEAEAIYEFDLPKDFTNLSGNYDIEFWVKAKVNNRDEMITSSKAKYTVKPSILTDLDEAIEDHGDYPLFLKLMEEVKVINETAHELDTTIRTLQADMIDANNEMKTNEATRQANEATRQANEATRISQENARQEYLNTFDGKWQEYKANTDTDIANYKAQINEQEAVRNTQEQQRQDNEQQRIANENDRIYKDNRRESQERDRVSNEYDRENAEQSREYAEMDRVANEEIRQTNEANREAAEEIRRSNEQARITAETARITEHEQMRTELNEVKAENAILMENDKKVSDRMTQVEISDKRQYVIMEGLMNSAGDGYLKIEDTGNDTTLYNSVEGFVDVKNITGNTMVNSIKNPDDELTLNGDINTSGQSVTLTTAVDNGQVDVLAEGNTMVNVCDQQEAVAITKSYTVETGNHVALQGEYDGKCRPVVYGNTLVNLVNRLGDREVIQETNNGSLYGNMINLKPSTIYTLIYYIKASNNFTVEQTKKLGMFRLDEWYSDGSENTCPYGFYGDLTTEYQKIVAKFTTNSNPNLSKININIRNAYTDSSFNLESNTLSVKDVIILEGDYTNKPIPDYFSGMQSSFEDKLVTQEMVDSGEELAENLGKYRVDYKVTGKNKFDGEWERGSINTNTGIKYDNDLRVRSKNYNAISSNTNISVSGDLTLNNSNAILYYDKNYNYLGRVNFNNLSSTPTFSNAKYFKLLMFEEDNTEISLSRNIQIEEGSTATAYEPYKESIKTYYLNSPLLEGDTIEESNGSVYHVHRSKQIVLDGSENWKLNGNSTVAYIDCNDLYKTKDYTNCIISNKLKTSISHADDVIQQYSIAGYGRSDYPSQNWLYLYIDDNTSVKSYLQDNPLTVAYKLASPQYELISQNDTILTDSYVAGHLDFDTAVPVERVRFRDIIFMLKYKYQNTKYNIQFYSDNIGKVKVYFDGWSQYYNVNKGINKITLTSAIEGNENISIGMSFEGIGFNASNIVVTEATDKDFGYFSGMKSVGELEENKIEILSSNKNLFDINNIFYNSRPYTIDGNNISFTPISKYNEIRWHVKVKPNCEYIASFGEITGGGVMIYNEKLLEGHNNKTVIWFNDTTKNSGKFTTKSDYITIRLSSESNTSKLVSLSNFQLEEGTQITSYVPHAENKKQIILNEPLRAVGDTKDRFVQIDGKWYVERNCGEYTIPQDTVWTKTIMVSSNNYIRYYFNMGNIITNNLNASNYKDFAISDSLPFGYSNSWVNCSRNELQIINNSTELYIQVNLSTIEQVASLMNGTKIIYKLDSPTYEPVEIAPTLNTYTDVTHITNNSTIPMNMNIKNSGYEVIAKPSTKYTVVGITNGRIGDSTIVNGTITTPATITDNFLRPYGSGKVSKVMLLEGEPANIPSYFKGIKSVFEDKATEDGKYAVEVKVVGKNKFDGELELGNINEYGANVNNVNRVRSINYNIIKPNIEYHISNISNAVYIVLYDIDKNFISRIYYNSSNRVFSTPYNAKYFKICVTESIDINENIQIEEGTVASEYEPYHETKQTLYLDEPLYNTNNITIYNDKLGYWKNWDKVVLDGSGDEGWMLSYEFKNNKRFRTNTGIYNGVKFNCLSDYFITKETGTLTHEGFNIINGNIEFIIHKAKLSTQDVAGFKQYLSENPVTVVYQLAEPVFVPVIDNCPNWVIGSWDNCSIHFDSIIPLKDTRYRYTGNVPSVVTMSEDIDTVSSISDEQDALLIDMATELAVMKLTM